MPELSYISPKAVVRESPIQGRGLFALEAIKRHKPTVRDWFQTARNHALYANQSGLYDEILAYLKISK